MQNQIVSSKSGLEPQFSVYKLNHKSSVNKKKPKSNLLRVIQNALNKPPGK